VGFGDEESISKNKETINNPAIAAPIIISDPISSCSRLLHAGFQLNLHVSYRPRVGVCAANFQFEVIANLSFVSTDARGRTDVAAHCDKFM